MPPPRPIARRLEVGEVFPGSGPCSVAADIYLPKHPRAPATALFCLPGGGMNRHYFDLGGEGDFSFAEHLSERQARLDRGFSRFTVDHHLHHGLNHWSLLRSRHSMHA